MSKSASASSSSSAAGALKSKSPAEFFAEHQNIAGFDNPGKSLYTTIREFIENSLDAAEAIRVPPLIELKIEKLSSASFHALRGIEKHTRGDHGLYEKTDAKTKSKNKKAAAAAAAAGGGDGELNGTQETKSEEKENAKEELYFRITCRDNGAGMAHASIPQMLGVVLSSTKYGVKQTRGKFGLGAKMALVWAMKSTGLPITVHSAISRSKPVSLAKMYIDINKNQPDIVQHEQIPNDQEWQGTEISVVIGGAWRQYQAKILNYMRQLAVITPYAQFELEFIDQDNDSKSWTIVFDRRTDVMPPPPKEVKHHPSSVDNLRVEQLIHDSKANTKLKSFLKSEFSGISASLAERLCGEVSRDIDGNMSVHDLSKKQIHQLTQVLRTVNFDPPDPSCLSPAGEYNLRLGILKELNPDMVATSSQPADVAEGHPFIVEAAVSIGGTKAKPGISAYRYANRIPLLFEGGNDVVTIVANKKIKWLLYKVNPKTDKISVFVSIVSTKIPFKGTSKEYIGDDKGALHEAIKKAISACCLQLKKRIVHEQAKRTKADRRKLMSKYIPNVTRSIMTVLHSMADQNGVGASLLDGHHEADEKGQLVRTAPTTSKKRRAAEDDDGEQRYRDMVEKLRIQSYSIASCSQLLREVASDHVTDELLEARLQEHVDAKDAEMELEHMDAMDDSAGESSSNACFIAGMENEAAKDVKTIFAQAFKLAIWG